ncbi:UDP-glucuronosyl/UDP-glucosyltransferase [Dillenia turbinata]|uniref:Glycosyltransferase n=1 Tax=Dillenia turbinata TaxID=194707 RepID=A0AAN8VIK8_9MAGN
MSGEIFVVSASGQGHLYPCLELCKHLISRNYSVTLVIPSSLSSFVPSSLLQHRPHLRVHQVASDPGHLMFGPDPLPLPQAVLDLEAQLNGPYSTTRPLCAVIDFQMAWTKEVFWKYGIPVVSFFTFGACAAAMEWASWEAQPSDMKPNEVRPLPGLPEEMSLTYFDLKRRPLSNGPPIGSCPARPAGGGGPPKPGQMPPWVQAIKGSIGLLFNTCDEIERPFLDYMANQMAMPVWATGPLLPEPFWKSFGSIIHDYQIRQHRQSSITEDEVIEWLDSKPRGSVLYVSFGSELGPTMEEYPQLEQALELSNKPFIWVIPSGSNGSAGYSPHGLESRVGCRGLVIHGWAPQLMILSHHSTGGFLSHCGWNSTVESIGLGVPMLAWPMRGDQYFNAKLVLRHLKVGSTVSARDPSEPVRKEDIVEAIERLMGQDLEEYTKRAAQLRSKLTDLWAIGAILSYNH